jgi:hypothetical protein
MSAGISLNGGLGNRLFQVGFIYCYGKKFNKNIGYIEDDINHLSKINYLKEVYPFLKSIQLNNPKIIQEEFCDFSSFVHNKFFDGDIIFKGYFQNEKYFYEYSNELKNLFKFPKLNMEIKKNSIFIHVRRGDYVDSSRAGFHFVDLTEYYKKCIEFIKKKVDLKIIYVISDDIYYCVKENLFKNDCDNVIYINLNELETMSLMKETEFGGICANSSFSFWGAYLNTSPKKLTFFPSQWFNPTNTINKSWKIDIFFENSYVVDMKTFEFNQKLNNNKFSDILKSDGSIMSLYDEAFQQQRYEDCQNILKRFEFCAINDDIIYRTNPLLTKLNKKIIGTTFLEREPKKDEIVIVYGNFFHSFKCLPCGNKIYRHVKYFNDIIHNEFEYHKSWTNIDKIFIINLEERKDKLYDTLNELHRLHAPLPRIHIFKAIRDQNGHVGCAKSHLECLKIMLFNGYENCLFIEDDLTFSDEIQKHINDLGLFFERKYDYDVCLLASSKYGSISNYDDILYNCHQECTTTAGYMLSKNGAKKILPIVEEGLRRLIDGGNPGTYACDRYWTQIQKDKKFFLFKNKFGYQKCGISSTSGGFTCDFN